MTHNVPHALRHICTHKSTHPHTQYINTSYMNVYINCPSFKPRTNEMNNYDNLINALMFHWETLDHGIHVDYFQWMRWTHGGTRVINFLFTRHERIQTPMSWCKALQETVRGLLSDRSELFLWHDRDQYKIRQVVLMLWLIRGYMYCMNMSAPTDKHLSLLSILRLFF